MTVKENPNVVGEIPCTAPNCTQIAEVRQREKGKKLKYLYCPTHKVNQMAGDDFQKYINENMGPVGTLQEADIVPNDGKNEDEQTEVIEPKGDLWRPQTKKPMENSEVEELPLGKSGITTIHVVSTAAVVALLAFAGWWYFRNKAHVVKPEPANQTGAK
jgi:hypothetical protein